MDQQAIELWDLKRILVGDVPWVFLAEVIIRIIFIYCLLVFSMRLMGKRMAGTINRNELAALVSLAAAIGIPMQQPDKGLLPAFIIAMIVVGIQRLLAIWSVKNKKVETTTQGDVGVIVEDGCLMIAEMERTGFSRERIFAQLRGAGIRNLAEVQRLYLESNGGFSLLRNTDSGPGLSVIPQWDSDFYDLQVKDEGLLTCENCGNVSPDASTYDTPCDRCGNIRKVSAVSTRKCGG